MDLMKHLDFFNPEHLHGKPVHIIGLGAIGSNIAETLARLGIEEMHLYDFDTVDSPNIANQMYFQHQLTTEKTKATEENLKRINPNITITLYEKGWEPEMPLNGHVFIAVDSIETRKEILETNKFNQNIDTISDYRMRLTDAQHYCAKWGDLKQKETLIKATDFSEEEAKEATPLSACGTTLSVYPTIKAIVALGIANWMNIIITGNNKTLIMLDTFVPNILTN
jgi:hypothetical protein